MEVSLHQPCSALLAEIKALKLHGISKSTWFHNCPWDSYISNTVLDDVAKKAAVGAAEMMALLEPGECTPEEDQN
ncbi:uncharacterized [Tachysurus ichikawai]